MTLRQALSGRWQIPLFLVSGAVFVLVLLQMRPGAEAPAPASFEERLRQLKVLSQENRYTEFYQQAELARLEAESEEQLGQVYALAAQARVKQLKQLNQFEIDLPERRSVEKNYRLIIQDYNEALKRGQPDPESEESRGVYHDVALAYWCLNEADDAIRILQRAIEASEAFEPILHRQLVQMYFLSRPENYLSLSMEHLERLMTQSESSTDDKAWAFLRKVEVLLGQGQEDQALALLERADQSLRDSRYGEELEFLRGRGLHQKGQTDQADEILRKLIEGTTDRGDIYAQIALELGRINYEQYRDLEAERFFQSVVETQMGKDWYAAGKWGLAESALLQQRYERAFGLYRETVDFLKRNPHNRALTLAEVQKSLSLWAQRLSLYKEYGLALSLLEIEQQIATEDDINAAHHYAQTLARRGMQLQEQLQQSGGGERIGEASAREDQWREQLHQQICSHFERAAEQYLRVAYLAAGDDELYEDCLWQGASCYDKAGNVNKTIETWHRFVSVREGESRWPRALFNLAQSYQSTGQFAEAIEYYKILQDKHPTSLAAFDGIVPLAHCYLALAPPEREKAEVLLRSVLQDPAINPPSSYFRDALFELGELYYESQNYAEAINRLTEAIDRYPQDRLIGKSMYLVGDSYRRSGLALDALLKELSQDPSTMVRRQRTTSQRESYLENARIYFDRAIDFYLKLPEDRRSRLDEMYMRHCWLYRGDCLYDLGRYEEAAKLYELAALRHQLTPTALSAFIQIVNCQLRLGNPGEARSANQRAIRQLQNMPDEALAEGPTKMTRQQWRAWFEGTERSNLW